MPIAAGGFGNDITVNVIASIIASALLLAAGFLWGKYKERQRFGKKLEEYDFYPYTINRDNFPEFSLKDFRLGMHYFLRNFDPTAARQLIFPLRSWNAPCCTPRMRIMFRTLTSVAACASRIIHPTRPSADSAAHREWRRLRM
jgi:hypothetical protein